MDQFFAYELEAEPIWFDGCIPVDHSAFVSYTDQSQEGFPSRIGSCGDGSGHRNVNKRMIEFLRKRWIPTIECKEREREKCHRHMISERTRREKEKQSYCVLHRILPPGTKNDKNSIAQAAAKQIAELQRCKEELERRNSEVEAVLGGREINENVEEAAKIKLRVAYPSSAIDSMVEVLKCVKYTGSKARAIQSKLSAEELSAVLEIEGTIGAAEVEKEVQRTLFEVERKFLFYMPLCQRD